MFKVKNLIKFMMPQLSFISMGGGSSTTTPTLSPEQIELLKAQTGFLTNTAFPAYGKTIGGAENVLNQVMPNANAAAANAVNVAQQTGGYQQAAGTQAYGLGLANQGHIAGYQGSLGEQLTGGAAAGLGNAAEYQKNVGQILGAEGASKLAGLFSPDYEKQQVTAALQPAMEQTREAMGGQNASYGAAGSLGSSRAALAEANLRSLSNQRLGTVAAQTQQGIESNRSAASQALLSAGQNATNQSAGYQQALLGAGQGALSQAAGISGALTGAGQAGMNAANQSAAAQIGYAGTPQDVYNKYASVIYGTPQASTTPNFSGTQGSNSSGKGKSAGFGK
jgi:hypothetical protein